ncbi:MAG: hypothetical protein LUG56_00795 [Lachnospiraceae bacterium]|nr:hypothetical protein [Lachnospiraceae bacterium]MCD7840988.1 hypothetical protein [Lachnospiraceae bacterium]
MNKKTSSKPCGNQAALLKKELRGYEKAGTHLYLDGRRCHADEIVSACLFAEGAGYMRDLIGDDQDTITDINFVKIRL